MLGLGSSISTASPGGASQTKNVVYQSDFTSDTDGWQDHIGLGGLTAPSSSTGGLTDALKYAAAISVGGSRQIRLPLSSYTLPSEETTYTIDFTFEGAIQTTVTASFSGTDALSGNYTDADTPDTFSVTRTATGPDFLYLTFAGTGGNYNSSIHFKNIEVYYYS